MMTRERKGWGWVAWSKGESRAWMAREKKLGRTEEEGVGVLHASVK